VLVVVPLVVIGSVPSSSLSVQADINSIILADSKQACIATELDRIKSLQCHDRRMIENASEDQYTAVPSWLDIQ
jgi:hypothetical protein